MHKREGEEVLIPSKGKIANEVQNYKNLSFFKKSKNVLGMFVLLVAIFSFLALPYAQRNFSSIEVYGVMFQGLLAILIFLNNKWAMVVFVAFFLINKVVFLYFSQTQAFSQVNINQVIWAVIAVILTYRSFRVAIDLRKANGIGGE